MLLEARATMYFAPSSRRRSVVSKELWKSSPMATMQASKLRTPSDSRKCPSVLSAISALFV